MPFPSSRLPLLVVALHADVRARVERAVAAIGADLKQGMAVYCLGECGPLPQGELGKRIGVDRTTIVGVADALERAGLIERRRDASDRRAYELHLTASGRRLQRSIDQAMNDAEREIFSPLTATERERFIELCRRLVAGGPAASAATGQPQS
ncbi:MarR family transcriptional regulator [Nocardia terpenica]|uniref:HTH marR-type domain-containing protein n=1 Tax=Nocardia terpenica TaxID=455432 RepID=A0A164JL56_9NOCA|nr:MarR family transcriptional regulator [Nocardia terpenica]KZM70506.1 hypothetical protein AWN90_38605 [Nocardia terpenica]MBF6060445.1 MarR family transcriptional regulator [Nocardia terpenica]MBF6103705.1 MarR family transcriptional regulator [Nocardia terpenica]MBF6111921.1 MarR family transcriptional regulator [Nocardia terpenica]MBF6117926.1 MarR family transcriptional regulator [Nocardia terpenica]